MKAEDLIPFDPATVPWETHPNDWALCLTTEPEGRVWVEHRLIKAVLEADHLNTDNVANIHGTFTAIGGKVAAVFTKPEYVMTNNQVRAFAFSGNPVVMRVGCFGDELFVFLPKPEFEEGPRDG